MAASERAVTKYGRLEPTIILGRKAQAVTTTLDLLQSQVKTDENGNRLHTGLHGSAG
jgi:hypothetical protein